jgi:hypothetical protein
MFRLALLTSLIALVPLQAAVPFLEEQTVAVLKINVEQLDLGALKKPLSALFLATGEEFPPKDLAKLVDLLKKQQVKQLTVLFSLADLPEKPPFMVATLPAEANAAKTAEVLNESKVFAPQKWAVVKDHLVLGAEGTLKRLEDLKAAERPDLTRAEGAVAKGLLQLFLIAPADSRKLVEESIPTFPAEIGGGSTKVLTRGLKWMALVVEAPPALTLRFTLQASDKEAAEQLQQLWSKTLKFAALQPPVKELLPQLPEEVARLTPEVDGDQLKLRVESAKLLVMLEPPLDKVRKAAQRQVSVNNLKQIGLAFHNYLSAMGTFPAAAITSKDGKKLLSWRVAILPYIEHEALYKEFHLDEPWDSEHNKKLIPRMPKIYGNPGNPKLTADGKTTYLLPVGKETMHPGVKGMKIADVTDGTSLTIMTIEAADANAAIWTKPEDLEYKPKEPLKGLGLKYNDGFLCGFADGSVRVISKNVMLDTLRAIFTPNGGEVVGEIP